MESPGDEKVKIRLKGKELYKRGWKRTEGKKSNGVEETAVTSQPLLSRSDAKM